MMKPGRFLTESSKDLAEPVELEESLPHLPGAMERDLLPPVSEV